MQIVYRSLKANAAGLSKESLQSADVLSTQKPCSDMAKPGSPSRLPAVDKAGLLKTQAGQFPSLRLLCFIHSI